MSRPDILEGRGLQAAGERFKLEHLLVVQYQRVQSKPYMDVRLFTFPGVTPLMSTAMFVPPPRTTASAKGGDFSSGKNRDSQTPANQKPLLLRILTGELDAGAYSSGESSIPLKELVKFPFVVTAMDVAVAPADKVARLAVADTDRIYLYRIVDGKLEAEWTFKADARGRIFSVQLADLDGDGVLEVVANRYHPNPSITMTSFILTTREHKPVRLVDNISEILLAVDTEGSGVKRTLWGQDWAQGSFFKKGQATRYTIRDGKLVTDRAVRVSASFRATGAAMTNIAGKEVRALAFIDEWSRLQITMEGEEMWRSSAPVGGGIPKLAVETQIERGGRIFSTNRSRCRSPSTSTATGSTRSSCRRTRFPGASRSCTRGRRAIGSRPSTPGSRVPSPPSARFAGRGPGRPSCWRWPGTTASCRAAGRPPSS